jgi:hypothetical protein
VKNDPAVIRAYLGVEDEEEVEQEGIQLDLPAAETAASRPPKEKSKPAAKAPAKKAPGKATAVAKKSPVKKPTPAKKAAPAKKKGGRS